MSEPKASEVLMLAKDKVIDSWVPRVPHVNTDEVCAVTAILHATDEFECSSRFVNDTFIHLQRVLPLGTEFNWVRMTEWNDSGPKQKVIDGFDAAIRLAKEQEQV